MFKFTNLITASSLSRVPLSHQSIKSIILGSVKKCWYSSRELESIESYEKEWVDFFKNAPDQFELYRGLNNAFSYDIIPTVPIVKEVLLACRRLNHFPTAIRLLAAIRSKVDNLEQYNLYLKAIEDLRLELGVPTPEEIGV